MRRLISLICLAGIMAISLPVLAGEPVINHIADALTGNNDFLETRGYLAVTIDLEKVPLINILNADLRIKASTPIGDGSFRTGILETGLEWEF